MHDNQVGDMISTIEIIANKSLGDRTYVKLWQRIVSILWFGNCKDLAKTGTQPQIGSIWSTSKTWLNNISSSRTHDHVCDRTSTIIAYKGKPYLTLPFPLVTFFFQSGRSLIVPPFLLIFFLSIAQGSHVVRPGKPYQCVFRSYFCLCKLCRTFRGFFGRRKFGRNFSPERS